MMALICWLQKVAHVQVDVAKMIVVEFECFCVCVCDCVLFGDNVLLFTFVLFRKV